jgi:hypothetical protein
MEGIIGRFGHLVAGGSLVRQGLLDPQQATTCLSRFDKPFLYKLVFLECWCRLHLDGETVESLAGSA